MSDQATNDVGERVEKAASDLGEFADAVLVLATSSTDGRDPGTVHWSYRGNTTAACGLAMWFEERMREAARIAARRQAKEDQEPDP